MSTKESTNKNKQQQPKRKETHAQRGVNGKKKIGKQNVMCRTNNRPQGGECVGQGPGKKDEQEITQPGKTKPNPQWNATNKTNELNRSMQTTTRVVSKLG